MGRTLIYIPIIHTDPDLGSLASDVEERAVKFLGKRWKKHKRTIKTYWSEIVKFFNKKDLKGVKVFQDGLPVDDERGKSLVNKLAKTGSPNYKLIKKLINQGAVLQKTEDVALLKKEYQMTKDLVAKRPLALAVFAFLNYKLKKGKLLKARDRYIAIQINQSLRQGETGVCFLGAYHQVLAKLPKDIKVVLFKDPDKVRQYYKALSIGRKTEGASDLVSYLTKPVKGRT